MSTRIMLDALDTSGVPAGTKLACWYPFDERNTSGPPKADQILTIDNNGSRPTCDIVDVESGAVPDSRAPSWVSECSAAFPTVYRSYSFLPTLFQAMEGTTKHWYLWVAKWVPAQPGAVVGVPNLPSNCTVIGQQFEDPGPYDVSIITFDGWYPLSSPGSAPAPSPIHTYTVEPGDSLSAIAFKEHLSGWEQLYEANRAVVGGNPNRIYPGQVLVIPSSSVQIYTVEAGDNLSTIARKFGLDGWESLYQLNRTVIGNDPNLIHPGQHLIIP